ncbi:MAG: UDP-glucose 4-epimerase GalE [Patescibacteria group bacterium]
MSKVLIVGGAGYIGSQTNLHLLEQGLETVVFDNLVYGHIESVPENCTFIEGDLLNPQGLIQAIQQNDIEAVVHFAAYAYVGESVEKPSKYYRNNVVGTLNLLDAMLETGVNKLIFSSTCATFGIPNQVPITEQTPQNPINPYGRTKLMVEQILMDYAQAYGLSSIALRYFNACGADPQGRTGEMHDPETHLIPLILDVAAGKRDSIKVFGTDYNTPDGTCIRDYIHTCDLASAHYLALKKLESSVAETICERVNLGTGRGYSVNEIIETCKKVTGQNIKIEYVERRPGDPDELIADNQKATNYLGWKPVNSELDNIIQTAWNWHQHKNF